MSETVEVVLLGIIRARELVTQIKAGVENVRKLLLELYEGQGWIALGYDTWRECVATEFQQGQRRLYQLLDAELVQTNLCTMVQKLGETNDEQIPERVLRPLTALKSPEKQREAYKEATEEAKKEGKKRPTAKQVQKAANRTLMQVPKTEEQIKAEELRMVEQGRRLAAENLYTILGTLGGETAEEVMDYNEEKYSHYKLPITKELWKRSIITLRGCAKIWEARK